MTKRLCALLIAGLAPVLPGAAQAAEGYPERPVRLVVPYPPGGAADLIARIMGKELAQSLGQQMIIDNRAGGGQIIGSELVAKAAPDGYTILQCSVTHAINPGLVPKLPYDTQRDFTPVAMIAKSPLVLVVHPSVPAKSVKALIALAKARPGELNYASSGNGSGGHLAMALFTDMTATKMVHVPYKGAGPALTDLMAGQTQALITSPLAAVPHVKQGKLRLLGSSGPKRSQAMPDVPAIAETVPGYEVELWYAFLGPKGLPANVVSTLNKATLKALGSAEVRKLFEQRGVEAAGSTPEELARHIDREIEKWRKVIGNAGIRRG